METEEKALCPRCGCVTAEEPTCLDCWREIYKAREQAIANKWRVVHDNLTRELAFINRLWPLRKYTPSLRAACRTARLLKQELDRIGKLTVADRDWPNWNGKTKAP